MGTLMQDTNDNDAGNSPNAGDLPAPPGKSGGKNPPKYPSPARRPPNMPAPTGGSSGGGPVSTSPSGGSFFTIRKKGQGYWTRMGTVGGAALIGALTVDFIYNERGTFNLGDFGGIVASTVFFIAYAVGIFYFMNQPVSVDFLIATDSEMKKVNWTSRAELMGSTKVVILFMFVIAIFLFLADLFFAWFFRAIGVLKY